MKHQRFTLIELLVVVAIIGVLASLLLPALSRARESAVSVDCMNRQHQLGLAVHAYRDDSDELYPVNYVWANTVPEWTGVHRFPELVKPYLQLDDIGIYTTASSNTLMCPANPYNFRSDLGWSGIRVSNYAPHAGVAVNYWAAVQYGFGLRYAQGNMPKRTEPSNPSSTILSGEGAGNGCYLGYVTSGVSSLFYFHFGDRANLLIADGHVEPYQRGMPIANAGLQWNK